MLQPICRLAPARPLTPSPGHAGTRMTTCQALVTAGRVTPAPRPSFRASSCVGAGGSGTMGPAVPVQSVTRDQAEAVAEKLEVLEAAAIAGEDEGRRPTDYNRRAHIFEESSRVFRELKQRRDDGDFRVQGGGDGSGTADETAATQQLG